MDQMFGAAGVGGGDEGREETLVAEGAQPPAGVDVGEQRQQGGFVEDQGVVGELGKKLRHRQRRPKLSAVSDVVTSIPPPFIFKPIN